VIKTIGYAVMVCHSGHRRSGCAWPDDGRPVVGVARGDPSLAHLAGAAPIAFRRDGLLDAAEAQRCIAAEAVALEITRHIPGWPNKRRLDPAPLLAALQVMPM
jgi:hypothetical protein